MKKDNKARSALTVDQYTTRHNSVNCTMQYKIQTIKYRLDWTGLGTVLQTGNLEPTKYNLVYQTIPEKIVKVDKLQSTFEGAEGTKINSIRRKAIPDVYNSVSEKYRPYSVLLRCLNNL